MSDQLHVFSDYGNRFVKKYGDRLGDYAGVGAVAMGLLAELMRCDCGGMRVALDSEFTRIACPRCKGEWAYKPRPEPRQLEIGGIE